MILHSVSFPTRSAFFFFCAEERPNVRAANPGISVADVAKELGKKWEVCPNKPKFEQLATEDKARYERVSNTFLSVIMLTGSYQ